MQHNHAKAEGSEGEAESAPVEHGEESYSNTRS